MLIYGIDLPIEYTQTVCEHGANPDVDIPRVRADIDGAYISREG